MVRQLPLWRRLGSALAALVLAVLAFGPGLDAVLCHEVFDTAAAAQPADRALEPEHGHGGPETRELGVCLDGHCHHGASHVPAALAAADAIAPMNTAGHALGRDRVPTSDAHFGLIRPPRA